MPRPRKRRRVCGLPDSKLFGPLDIPADEFNTVNMTVDEYETIRLIDIDRFTQEECADQMNISRTTVQGIYNEARRKLAESLVNGKVLCIEGGDYQLCDGRRNGCGRGGCRRHRGGRGIAQASETENNLNAIKEDSNKNSNTGR
ncbi:MAG: DUF134 domain-containing protein [Eubacteriales bacterium]|jgi:predicted DNA-binding protein (UPF0251 family)